jgi:hypothetical protein
MYVRRPTPAPGFRDYPHLPTIQNSVEAHMMPNEGWLGM